MPLTERLGDDGYLAFSKETTAGTIAAIPSTYAFMRDAYLNTMMNRSRSKPATGSRFSTYRVLPGMRSFPVEFTIDAEPNTAHIPFDMLMTVGSVTGSDPYTWAFTFGTTKPNSYTVDRSDGTDVIRHLGVQLHTVEPVLDGNEWRLKCTGTSLRAFNQAEIASVSTNVVTLKTTYDTSPTRGLIANDLVAIFDESAGTYQNFTISSLTSTTVTLSGSPSGIVAGDTLKLRPATPSFPTSTEPFLFTRTEFRFSDTDAATALSATHTPMEQQSTLSITWPFNTEEGEHRSGSPDPAAILRKRPDVALTLRKLLEDPSELRRYLITVKRALVIRMFSGSTNQHELRLTFNDIRTDEGAVSNLAVDEVSFLEMPQIVSTDTSDGQAFDAKVINGVSG